MSFFIKGKRKNGLKQQKSEFTKTTKKFKNTDDDDELTSESEVENDSRNNVGDDESDEEETAQEKRVKLAKIYLEEIRKLENKDDDDDDISLKLKEDYLKQTGKFRKFVADQYTKAVATNLLRNKYHKLTVTCVCVSSDNKYIYSGSKDGGIIKWLLLERKKEAAIRLSKKGIVCLAISDNFKYLAVSDNSNDILILNPDNLTLIHTFKGHRNQVTGLVFRKNEPLHLYSCSKDRSVKSWSLDEMSYLETLFGHQSTITGIDALTRERAVTSGGNDSSLRLWKIPEESQLIFNGTGSIDSVKLLNEDNFISGGDTGELSVWSSMKKKPLCSIKNAHGLSNCLDPNWISCVATFVNTDLIASGSCDGFIRLWKVSDSCRTIQPLLNVPVEGFINSLVFTTDGNFLIAGVGQEHHSGRWSTIKSAKNGIMIISLLKETLEQIN